MADSIEYLLTILLAVLIGYLLKHFIADREIEKLTSNMQADENNYKRNIDRLEWRLKDKDYFIEKIINEKDEIDLLSVIKYKGACFEILSIELLIGLNHRLNIEAVPHRDTLKRNYVEEKVSDD